MITSLSRDQILARQGYGCAHCRRPAQRTVIASRRLPAYWFDAHANRWRDGQGNLTRIQRGELGRVERVEVQLTIQGEVAICQACSQKELVPVENWETADESAEERREHCRRAALARWELRPATTMA